LPLPDWFFDLFEGLPQQGPGDDDSTRRAVHALGKLPANPRILDIGSGPGRQTFALARTAGGRVIPLDNHAPFLHELRQRTFRKRGTHRIRPVVGDMERLPFAAETFDVIWSEGTIYLMGFAAGLRSWRPLLSSGGRMAVTDVCWLVDDPPPACSEFWQNEYPTMGSVKRNLVRAEAQGYEVLDHFRLPPRAWWHDFYTPLEERIARRRRRWRDMPDALALLRAVQQEIDLLREYPDAYGYVFFILRKTDS
jgi:SAM-dependent methyltransferase